MEDSVRIKLPLDRWGGAEYVRNVLPDCLSNVKSGKSDNFGYYVSGQIDSLWIHSTEKYLTLEGSLPNFVRGDNTYPCTFEEKLWVFGDLEERLQLSLNDGLVKRIDISNSFCMSRTPMFYFGFLVEYPLAKRLLMDSSLEFRSGRKQVAFYDKGRKEKMEGINLMRYELRLLNGKPKTKNLPATLNVQDLLSPNVHNALIKLWQEESLQIRSKPNFTSMANTQNVNSLKTFKELLYVIGLQKIGEVEALRLIEDLKKEGAFPNIETPSRIKKFIREEMNNSIELDGLPIEIIELNNKIQKSVEEYSV